MQLHSISGYGPKVIPKQTSTLHQQQCVKWVKVHLSKAGPVVLALGGCFVLFPSKSTNFPKDSKPWNFNNLRMYLKNSKLIRLFISWNDKMRTENKIEINTVIPVLHKYNYFRMAYSCMPWNDTQWQDIQKKTSFERIIFDPKPSVFGRGRLEE